MCLSACQAPAQLFSYLSVKQIVSLLVITYRNVVFEELIIPYSPRNSNLKYRDCIPINTSEPTDIELHKAHFDHDLEGGMP